MPFTTMNNYNWLFDVDSMGNYVALPVDTSISRTQLNMPTSTRAQEYNRDNDISETLWTSDLSGNSDQPHSYSGGHHKSSTRVESIRKEIDVTPAQNLDVSIYTATIPSNPVSLPQANTSPPRKNLEQIDPALASKTPAQETPIRTRREEPTSRHATIIPSNPLYTFGQTSSAKRLPIIDELTRHQVLDLVIQAGPKTPEGSPIMRDHPLLSLSALQNYCDLFFCRFNVTYPLIHEATFEPSQVEPLLLVSVLLLGATYGDKAGHGLAVCIHDVLRAHIFQHSAFKAQPDLWILQAILLVECFGKSRAGQTQHDMSHLFHGLLIK